jgi:hypothetical protein
MEKCIGKEKSYTVHRRRGSAISKRSRINCAESWSVLIFPAHHVVALDGIRCGQNQVTTAYLNIAIREYW